MLDPKSTRFWQAALQSGLMDAEGLQACWDALAPEKRTPDAVDRRLARQAIQQNRLTIWQGQQLLAGRSTGFRIDRYVLLNLIGQGGMGRVYLARDSRLERPVAVKILSPERVNNPRAIARFHREATVGAQLQHENLVRIYDEGESNGRCYLVMEYIEGKTIGQMIVEGGAIAHPVAAKLARQVALGLEHAQRKGLIHRDVNPWNIIVTREGVAKLTDMGLAIDLADEERLTRDGATVGTFDYVSPEQARHSHDVDTRSDVYSLGCTLYHMLSGRVPFPCASLPEKLFGHQTAEPESIESLVPAVPRGLSAVVSRMMRKLPDQRYSTPLEVAQALKPYVEDSISTVDHDTPPLQTMNAPPRQPAREGKAASGNETLSTGVMEATTAAPTNGSPKTREVSTGAPGAALPRFPLATTHFLPPTPDPSRQFDAGTELTKPPAAAIAAPRPPVANASSPAAAPVKSPAAMPPNPAPSPSVAPPVKAAPAPPPGLDLALDLGPEPSLTESITSNRQKSRIKSAEKSESLTDYLTGGPGSWSFRGSLAVAGGVLGVAAVIAAAVYLGGGTNAIRTRDQTNANPPTVPSPSESPTRAAVDPSSTLKATGLREQDVAVRTAGELRSAIRSAGGGRGHVVLLNSMPLVFSPSDAITIGGGRVTIRAGEGVEPVLKVDLRGGSSFLTTRTGSSLTIEGVTFEARYLDPATPSPLIHAASELTLDRCTFRVVGRDPSAGPLAGSRAVANEGSTVVLDGCAFEHFEAAVDLRMFNGSTATATNCLFVNSRQGEAGAAPRGLAFRLTAHAGGATRGSRALKLKRCTIHGPGGLELAGFAREMSATIDVEACAMLVDSVIHWVPGAPDGNSMTPPDRDALSWYGKGNQYDVRGSSWISLSRQGEPAEPWSDGPKDLAAWTKLIGAEGNPILRPVRFAMNPATPPNHPDPAEFALVDQADAPPVGIDPKLIGPPVQLRRLPGNDSK